MAKNWLSGKTGLRDYRNQTIILPKYGQKYDFLMPQPLKDKGINGKMSFAVFFLRNPVAGFCVEKTISAYFWHDYKLRTKYE